MKPLNEQINPKFVIQAKKLARYTQLLHQVLPIECRNHVTVANIRNQNLMLITDSPVWTTRLRQLSPQILQHLLENGVNTDASSPKAQIIHHIQISTRYSAARTSPQNNQYDNGQQASASSEKKRQSPQISEKTAKLLSQSASSINDSQLKAALLKIASHVSADRGKQPESKK